MTTVYRPIDTVALAMEKDADGLYTLITSGSTTVSSTQGTPAAVANAWPIKVTDGTSTAGISTVGSDKALKVDVVQTVGAAASEVTMTSGSLTGPLPAGTNAIGKLAANSGVDIGDVDVTSLPAGNLGQQLSAASLSVTPATNVADATYIGDIKFGEALPAGASIVGKVGIDQTTPGTTDSITVATGQGAGATVGVTTDAAVITDANGTLSGKLRGLVKWAFERMPAALGQGTMAQSLPVAIASNQSAVPTNATLQTGTNTVGAVQLADAKYSITHTVISTSGSGDNTIITPTSGSSLRIVKLMFMCNATNTITINMGTTGQGQTAKSGAMAFAANGGFAFDGDAWPMKFTVNKSLVLNMTAVAQVSGFVITYEE